MHVQVRRLRLAVVAATTAMTAAVLGLAPAAQAAYEETAWNPSPPLCHDGVAWKDGRSIPGITTPILGLPGEELFQTLTVANRQYKIYARNYQLAKANLRGVISTTQAHKIWVHSCRGLPGAARLAFGQEVPGVGGYNWVKAEFPEGGSAVVANRANPSNPQNGFQADPRRWTFHEVKGAIYGKWREMGQEKSILAWPISSESLTPNRPGAFQNFEKGSLYFSVATGTHEVRGSIRDKWAKTGWENGTLGFPTSDEIGFQTRRSGLAGAYSVFEHGRIYSSPVSGTHEVRGSIYETYLRYGAHDSQVGLPTSDEFPTSTGARTNFQNGCYIEYVRGSTMNGNGTTVRCG